MVRLATAAVLAPGLWVLIKLASIEAFWVFAVVISGAACWECYRMFETRGGRPFKALGLAAILALNGAFAGLDPRLDVRLPIVALVLFSVLLALRRRVSPAEMLEATLHTIFPVVFVGLGFGYLQGLRGLPGEDGKDVLLLLFVCVICADTAAFYVGTALGRHRLAPRVSPGKSWEGAIGGLLGSLGGALVAHAWFYQRLPLAHALALGLVLGVAAIVGDLSESMLKRAVGVKDSSGLLPGHGGVLDRTDSLLFSGPILYYYYRMFLQGAA